MNLLRNPNFTEGYRQWDNVNEFTIPNGWNFWYATHDVGKLARQDKAWQPPEMVVWNRDDAPADERDVLFLEGGFNLKGFGGWKPIWFSLFQDVSGLVVGQRYRFTVPVYPDLVVEYGGNGKVFAPDPCSGEVRLMVAAGVEQITTGWIAGLNEANPEACGTDDVEQSLVFGKYNYLTLEFTASAVAVKVSVSCRGRWGLRNNGWFLDALKLEAIGETVPPDDDDDDLDVAAAVMTLRGIEIDLQITLEQVGELAGRLEAAAD